MARHEFGMMEKEPAAGERYDRYEPERYACISVEDDLVDEILQATVKIPVYWHTRTWPAQGLAEAGITLSPPSSMDAMLEVIAERSGFDALEDLILRAKRCGKYVIHFGI